MLCARGHRLINVRGLALHQVTRATHPRLKAHSRCLSGDIPTLSRERQAKSHRSFGPKS